MRLLILTTFALFCACSAHAQLAEPSDRGVAFSHMHVAVADKDLHKKLWVELFAAVLIEKEGFTAASVPGALVFFADAEPEVPSIETAVDHFGLKVRSLDDVLGKWCAMGYEVDSESAGHTNSRTAYITMPGGIKLELQEDTDLSVDTRMGHVHFVTPRRDELVSWYSDMFGDEVPGARLSFSDSEVEKLPTEGSAIDHIGFEVENWDEFVSTLQSKNVKFVFGPKYFESLDLWVAFFHDPAGVAVEISHGLDHF